ncbi:MAG: NAD(P)/FAD-dependent oxidoreductase [Acidimicrobiaceae bacterium]|nr:NAD(P)/FAD-dependent oxidoreductase [Acidimicrobiaceae bacterium]
MRAEPAPVVIVGASLGGLRTAEALRRAGYAGDITLVGSEPHLPYMRPPLSKDALTGAVRHATIALPRRLAEGTVEGTVKGTVTWALGTRAVAADLEAHHLVTDAGERLGYTALVIATGVRPRQVVPSAGQAQGCHRLRTLEDAQGLNAALRPGTRVVVAGAGFMGCEVAASARKRGCHVTVVGSQTVPMQQPLGPELGARLRQTHEHYGVDFVMNARVERLVGDHASAGVVLEDGTVLPADVLVEAAGSLHNTEWLVGNDLDLDAGVLTDSALRALRTDGTPWRDVFAVGDVARFPHPLRDGTPQTIEHWNIPTETARRAGRVIALTTAGDPALIDVLNEPFAPMPTFWSDQFDIHLLAYGVLDRADEVTCLERGEGVECVYGYRRNGVLIGVCGIGLRSTVRRYRELIGTQETAPHRVATGSHR